MSESKRFEDWLSVDCNQCARYWDSSCDGVNCDVKSDKALSGSTRLCNSFLATRSVVIPAQLKRLEKRINWLTVSCVLIAVAQLIHVLKHIFGG